MSDNTNLIKEIADGLRDGERFFISDLRAAENPLNKPIRNVKPVEVVVQSNSSLPATKKIYYSRSHFRTLNANGSPSSKIIALFDNTGYRMRSGTPLRVFTSMDEAKASYLRQREVAISTMKASISKMQDWVDAFAEETDIT